MRSTLAIEVGDVESLSRVGADVAVAGFFQDQRPLRGAAGIADWRLCGWISRLLLDSRATGGIGEGVLVTTQGRLRASRLLLIGLGPRPRYQADTQRAVVGEALGRLLGLGVGSAALDLPWPNGDGGIDAVADAIVAGACDAFDPRPARMLLRLIVPSGGAARLRNALEQSISRRPRGATSIRMVRAPAAPGAGASSVSAAPRSPLA